MDGSVPLSALCDTNKCFLLLCSGGGHAQNYKRRRSVRAFPSVLGWPLPAVDFAPQEGADQRGVLIGRREDTASKRGAPANFEFQYSLGWLGAEVALVRISTLCVQKHFFFFAIRPAHASNIGSGESERKDCDSVTMGPCVVQFSVGYELIRILTSLQ